MTGSPHPLFEKEGRRRGWLYPLAALAVLLLAYLGFPGFFAGMENRLYDARLRLAGRPLPQKDILLVDIDDSSVNALGRWPWKRSVHAKAVEVMTRCGAGLIVFDVVFHGRTEKNEDLMLARAIEKSGRVILPAGFELVRETQVVRLNLGDDDRPLLGSLLDLGSPDVSSFHQVVRSFVPLRLFSRKALGVGHISASPDPDGIFRRLPLIIGFNGGLFPSLDLLAAVKYLGIQEMELVPDEGLSLKRGAVSITVPLDREGYMLINYAGRWDRSFEHIPFHEIYSAHGRAEKIDGLKEKLKGRLAIVSLVSSGTTDIGPTPLWSAEPLSVVHINAINTILKKAFITETSTAVNIGVALSMAAIIFFLSLVLRPLYFVLSSLGLIISFGLVNFLLFSRYSVVLNLAGVSLAAAAAFLVLLVHGYLWTARLSSIQRDVLKAYFSPQIIDQILESPESFSMKSANRELTVLFCDLAGFTGFSDTHHPEEVQKVLNEFMEEMIATIFKHQGAVDKIMGDGIMAFWGYPEDPELSTSENVSLSAKRAVAAASDMQGKLDELNRKWLGEGRTDFKMRVGVNTGYVTVGNMGSRQRMEFTLIGRHVNLAQRLEKRAPEGSVLITGRTYSLVRDEREAQDMGEVELKGIESPEKVYLVNL